MEEQEQAANQSDSATDTQQSANINNGEVTPTVETATTETTEASVNPDQGDGQSKVKPQHEVEAEWKRKYNQLVDDLPKMIEENVSKLKNKPQEEQEYTIEQLEQIAMNNPNLRPQVEAEKAKLQEKKFARLIEEREKKQESSRQAEMIRMRTEQEIMNDPSLKDVFTTNALGQKQWKMDHPLVGHISDIMRSPELSNRPDGLRIAVDIAYGRYMRDVMATNNGRNKQMQATIKREQKKTMVEGGNVSGSQNSADDFSKAKAQLAKTGSKQDAHNAVLAYMKKAGFGPRG